MLGLSLTGPAFAQPDVRPHSLDAVGCMKLRDCQENVYPITSYSQLADHFGDYWASEHKDEIENLIEVERQLLVSPTGKNLNKKITLLNKTPIINIIDEPVLPLEDNSISEVLAFLFGGFLGGFLSVVYFVFRKLFADVLMES